MLPDKQAADKRLKRILIIHKQLRRGPQSGEELVAACERAGEPVSLRTIRSDIAFMRSDVLNAPINANRYTGYGYSRSWSLLEGLDDEALGTLNEVLALVRQLADKKPDSLAGLEEALLGLEQQVSVINAEPYQPIAFENPDLKGRVHLIPLHRLIRKKVFVRFLYKPFPDSAARWRTVFPLQLREYNNRWFLVAFAEHEQTVKINVFGLERIESKPAETATLGVFDCPKGVNVSDYFAGLIGLTKSHSPAEQVILRFSGKRGDYVATKKIHHTQQAEKQADGTYIIQLAVELNKELEARILEFGCDVEVLAPPILRDRIAENLRAALANYH